MPEISTYRRAVRTRKALANAPAELLTQKELHRITVQEICEIGICDKADLNAALSTDTISMSTICTRKRKRRS